MSTATFESRRGVCTLFKISFTFFYSKVSVDCRQSSPITPRLTDFSQVFLVSAWNKICWAAFFWTAQLKKWAVTSMTVITQPFIFLCACGICHQFFDRELWARSLTLVCGGPTLVLCNLTYLFFKVDMKWHDCSNIFSRFFTIFSTL